MFCKGCIVDTGDSEYTVAGCNADVAADCEVGCCNKNESIQGYESDVVKDGINQGGEENDDVADGNVSSLKVVIDGNQDDCQFLSKCTFEETCGMISSGYFFSCLAYCALFKICIF